MISILPLSVLYVSGETHMVDRDFYSTGAGERYTESLTRGAMAEAESVSSFFYQLALLHRAVKESPKLEASRDELIARMDEHSKRITELDGKLSGRINGDARSKLQAERDAIAARYRQDSTALTQVETVRRWINTVRAPVAPVWLMEWMRDTIGHI